VAVAGAELGAAVALCASQATMSAWPRGNAPTASCAWRQAWGAGKVSTSGGCCGIAAYVRGAAAASARAASRADGLWACASKGNNTARHASRVGHNCEGDGEDRKTAGARMAISRQRTNKTWRCRPDGPVAGGRWGRGRRTLGVEGQAMGGLTICAAGTLSNCAEARGSRAPAERGMGVSDAGRPSMAEWQISQAEQLALW